MKRKRRIVSLLLCGAMLFSLCSQPALAVGNGQMGSITISAGSLCEHHPQHTAECGYMEGTAGTPCGHAHTEDCYKEVTNCIHEHTEDCYPIQVTPSDTENREPTECTHECSEESGCITKELNCQHEHDSECGYTEEVSGTPCNFVCEICNPQNGGDADQKPDDGAQEQCSCTTLCTEGNANSDCPMCGAEGADLALCKGEATPPPSNAEVVTVESVQAMIDALPGAEEITEDNAEEVRAQLDAIDQAKEKLPAEAIGKLDMKQYEAAAAALVALAAPMLAVGNSAAVAEVTIDGMTTQYTDIEAAFTAAQNAAGATLKLLADVTVKTGPFYTYGIELTQGTITLDLNGKTIARPSETTLTGSDYTVLAVFRLTGGSLTIQDTSREKTGKIIQPDGLPAVSVRYNASLTVTGGTIENTNSEDLRGEYSSLYDRNCAVNADGSANVTITGGTLKGLRGVVLGGNGSLTITGGDISGTTGNALFIKKGSATLSGGTFTSSNTHSIWVENSRAEALLEEGCSYIGENGTASSYSSDGKGVVGNTTVNAPVKNTVNYIDESGAEKTREDFTEITADTAELTEGWYAVKTDTTVTSLSVSGTANLILCDGATLTVSGALTLAEGAALHLYFQSGGTGKLTAATVTGKPDAPAGEMKQTTGDGGTTFEKCSEHDWGYTATEGDTHTEQCKLCGKTRTAAHSFGEWQSANETTHARTCVCGKTETANHSMTYVANEDGNTHSGTCSECGYQTADAPHSFGTDGSCTVCSARFVAQVGDTQYVTLTKAIEKANGADITLLRRFGENVVVKDGTTASIILGEDDNGASYWIANGYGAPLIMQGGSVTLKGGALSQGIIGEPQNVNIAISLNNGTLTIEGTVTKIQGTVGNSNQQPAICAIGGTLDLQGNTILDGGLEVSYDAAVKDGLKYGIFINRTDTARVSVENHSTYTSVFDLLATGYAFAKYDKGNGNTGDIIPKNDSKTLTEDVIVIKCTHEGSDGGSLFDENNQCTACGLVCTHEPGDNHVCTVCGKQIVAEDNSGKYYTTLSDALAKVADNGTVTVISKLPVGKVEFNRANTTVTLKGLDQYPLTNNGGTPTLTVSNGKLIITGDDKAAPIKISNNPDDNIEYYAVHVYGGTLEFGGPAYLKGGLWLHDGTLEGGLKQGSILTPYQQGSSVSNSTNNKKVLELLADGCAFAEADVTIDSSTGSITGATEDAIQSGAVESLAMNVMVVAHTHSASYDETKNQYVCACGFVCENHDFTGNNGVCKTCGYQCPHENVTEDTSVGTTTCNNCQMLMAVKVTTNSGTKYYAKIFDDQGGEVTLRDAFTDAESDSTITLLTDGLLAFATVRDGKTITLDFNGKQLVEHQGIIAGSDENPSLADKLIVKGKAVESTQPDDYKGTPCTFLVEGGTLELGSSAADNLSGTVSSVLVKSGKVTTPDNPQNDVTVKKLVIETYASDANIDTMFDLNSGSFGEISVSDRSAASRVTLGHLLEKDVCRAFKGNGGDENTLLLYDTQITKDRPVSDVIVVPCRHPDLTTGHDCPYCGYQNIVAVVVTPDNSIATFNADSTDSATVSEKVHSAFQYLNNEAGGTMMFYTDAAFTKDDTITAAENVVIDLNGHQITGGYTLTRAGKDGKQGTMTITDSSADKTGSFINNIVIGSNIESLTVEGVSVSKITVNNSTTKVTLKEGTKFIDYGIPDGVTLAQWIEDGCCVLNTANNKVVDASAITGTGTGTFTVKKIPAAITENNKNGSIPYNGKIPADLFPKVTMNAGEPVPQLTYAWYYETGTENKLFITATPDGSGGYTQTPAEDAFDSLIADNKLSLHCVITAKDGNGNILWGKILTGYELTVTPGDLSEATVTDNNADSLIYTPGTPDAAAQTLDFTVKNNGKTLTLGTDYEITNSSHTATDAGTHTLTLTGKGNYKGTLAHAWTIKPRVLTGIGDTVMVYDGTTALGSNDISFTYGDNGKVVLTSGEDKDFTMIGSLDSADVGNRTFTATVTLKNSNYTFANGMTAQLQFGVRVDKAATPTAQDGALTIVNRHKATYTYDVSTLLPALNDSCSYGTVTYGTPTVALDGYYTSGAAIENGKLNLPINSVDSDAEKAIGTITIPVSSTNYNDFNLQISVNAVNKIFPTGAPTLSRNTLTYGEKLSAIILSGTMQDDKNDVAVAGTFEWTKPDEAPLVGAYTAEWKFTPDDDATYMEVTGTATITVNKATPIGEPKYTVINTSGKKLSDAGLAANDGWPDGTVKWVDKDDKELSADTEVTANTAYKWVFTPADSENYNSIEGSVTLWRRSSGGSSSNDGDDSVNNDATIIQRPDANEPNVPTTVQSEKVKTDAKGNVPIAKSMVSDIIKAAKEDAQKHGNQNNGIAVEVPVEIDKKLDGVQITLKADALDALVKENVKRFTIDTDRVTDFGFTLDALKELNRQTSGDTILKVKKTTASSVEAKAAIGTRPAYDISLWEVKNGKETQLTSLNGKTISIAIPYTPAKNELLDSLYAIYVDGNGKPQWITQSGYDADRKAVILELTQSGIYGVGYDAKTPAFIDIESHWAKDNILFVVSRGLLNGTSKTTFSPNNGMTRGMFVTALGRLTGVDPADYPTGKFTDVKADVYYAPYVNWATSKGIVSGTTDTTFAPDSQINREQMAAIMKNYAAKLGYTVPKTLEAVTFVDNTNISFWAKEAVKSMQQAGILAGKTNNHFDPAGTATRAEVATVLRRFVEIVIDPQTANG